MGLYNGSFRQVGDATPADVAILDGNGNQLTGFDGSRPANAALTSVASSATSVTLLPANPARRQVIIVNAGNKVLSVAFAATATTAAYSFQIAANADYIGDLNGYTGIISGIWSAVNGAAKITEITT